jgi:hypothetical protein
MRASLAGARTSEHLGAASPLPLLDPGGAGVILGAELRAFGVPSPIVPGPTTMFGPRGACLASPDGPLIVCDTGHHRLLVWRRPPTRDLAPADLVVGQPDFVSEGCNAKGDIGPATFNVPTGVASGENAVAVADAWNHRVLVWHDALDRSNRPADVVLGQADFHRGLANRGRDHATADSLNWCYGVAIHEGRLLVSDTGNRRVLVWESIPDRCGAPADLVLGQREFRTRDENAGVGGGAIGMRWPHAITVVEGALLVADAGNNRVMVWRSFPRDDGAPCDLVLGQSDLHAVDHNQAAYHPTASAMNMPYGLAVMRDRLVVADTANSRILGFDVAAITHGEGVSHGAAARWIAGQPRFSDKGDNRWAAATRDSVCWPYAVAATGDTLVVADSGNNRVLLWRAAA